MVIAWQRCRFVSSSILSENKIFILVYLETVEGHVWIVDVGDLDILEDVGENVVVTVGAPEPQSSTLVCLNSLRWGLYQCIVKTWNTAVVDWESISSLHLDVFECVMCINI